MKIMYFIEQDSETGIYIATAPSIPGAHTQAQTLDELRTNLQEVVELCLQEMDIDERKFIPEFIGLSQVEIKID